MDNQGLIPYGLLLPIASFLVVLGEGCSVRLGGPAAPWCAVCALVHVPLSLLCLPQCLWTLCDALFPVSVYGFPSTPCLSPLERTQKPDVSPALVQNIFLNVILEEGRVKWSLPCPNESNSAFFLCVCVQRPSLSFEPYYLD